MLPQESMTSDTDTPGSVQFHQNVSLKDELEVPDAVAVSVTLTATASGTSSSSFNDTFWWNCTDPGVSVSDVMLSCGSIPTPTSGTCQENSNGIKCNGVDRKSV